MLRAFEKMALRKILGPKADIIVRGQRILHNYDLHNSNSAPHKIGNIKSKGSEMGRK
jgi:hypothetical protein